MNVRNELRIIPIDDRPGRHVDGVVRVRAVDAKFPLGGFAFEQREPLAIDVREGSDIRRIPFPSTEPFNLALAFAAAPLASFALTRLLRRRRN